MRDCVSGLATINCVPHDNNHVCMSDLCNAAGRLCVNPLLAAAILVLAVVVARYVR